MLILTIAFANNSFVFASESTTSAVYDLQKGGTQTFFIQNDNGGFDEIVIEEIKNNSRIDDSTYKVYYKAFSWTAGFYINVSNNKITNAYSPFYSVALGSISNEVLRQNSTTKATYSFDYKVTIMTYQTGVIATISNSELVVTKI